MVVATKRAVGSEYDYIYHRPSRDPDGSNRSRERARKRTSNLARTAKGVGLITLAFVICLSFIYLKAYQAELHHKAFQLRNDMAALQSQNEKIKLEIARLKALDRIELVAMNQLGMVKNDTVEYLSLDFGAVSKPAAPKKGPVPQEPAGAGEEAKPAETLLARIANAFATKNKMAKG